MKKFLNARWLQATIVAACCSLAGPALSAPETGAATFTTDGRSYTGQYSVADQALSVDIDGLLYQGHYASREESGNIPQASGPGAGLWGRAFLFASSAKVLQCTLDAGFPQVSGLCQDADGRKYALAPAARP
jgi:hypothetical protein